VLNHADQFASALSRAGEALLIDADRLTSSTSLPFERPSLL
jgi:hypothetical protein